MSKYFDEQNECACHCCGTLPEGGMDSKLMSLLDDMREKIGGPLILNCAYRCPAHNADPSVGGTPNSQHVMGTAADIDASDYDVETIASIAESLGADGVGRYPGSAGNFVHVDVRSGRNFDTYRW